MTDLVPTNLIEASSTVVVSRNEMRGVAQRMADPTLTDKQRAQMLIDMAEQHQAAK